MTSLPQIYESLHLTSSASSIVVAVALILFSGFLASRVTSRLHLPSVTGYILAGIVIGPYCCNLIPASIISGMDFMSDIALAFIAFSTGEYFKLSALRKNGLRVVVITLFETLTASLLVFLLTYCVLHVNFAFSLVLAAVASATAAASTLMTIRQMQASGDFVDTLLQVIALDNLIALIAYGIAISVAVAWQNGSGIHAAEILRPFLVNLAVLGLGGGFGWLMKLVLDVRSDENRLIVSIAFLFLFCGICYIADVSPLLGCMSMGAVYTNLAEDNRLFRQLNYFSPPLLLLYFVRSGLNFKVNALFAGGSPLGGVSLLLIVAVFLAARFAGKYIGCFLGCVVTGKSSSVSRYLGFAMIPQASVAIGLASLGARALGGDAGAALETVILAASLAFELIGPVLAKLSLYLSHSYDHSLEAAAPVPVTDEAGKTKNEAELLAERIRLIQKTLPAHPLSPEEQAFDEAAEEFTHYTGLQNRRGIRKR